MTIVQQIQQLIGVVPDGIWGKKSEARLREVIRISQGVVAPDEPKGTDRTDWRGYIAVDEQKLKALLPSMAKQLVPSFLKHAQAYNLNPLFLIAISKHETDGWKSNVFRTKGNAMGISNATKAVSVSSYDESIRVAARSLGRPHGLYTTCTTLASVGARYAPVGAKNDPTKVNSFWPTSVARYWSEFEQALA